MQKAILVVGSFVEDLIVQTNRVPSPGESVFGDSFHNADGGKGANQAVQAARLLAPTKLVGMVGSDPFAKTLVGTCAKSGIDVDDVLYTDGYSGISTVMLEGNDEIGFQNRIIMTPSANNRITVEDVKFLEQQINNFSLVILQNEITEEVNEYVAKLAHDNGVMVILNPAPYRPLKDELLSNLDYIVPNETEFASLTGLCVENIDEQEIRKASKVLFDKGVKNVIITLGSKGSCLINKNEFIFVPSVQNVKAVDPTAAGDSFIGAFGAFLSRGFDIRKSILLANAVGSFTVQRLGAMPSLCTIEEFYEYLLIIKDKNYQGLAEEVKPLLPEQVDVLGVYKKTIDEEVGKTLSSLNEEFYEKAVNIILEAKKNGNRVHVTGIGKPSHIAQYFASLISSTGTPAYYLHGTEAVHGSSGQLVAGDVVIAISNSGNTSELLLTINAAKNNGCKIIGVTGNENSQIAKLSDAHLLAHIDFEGGPLGRAPRASIIAETIVLQGLSVLLQEDARVTPRQYVKWHPGGALGKLKDNEK